MHLGYASVEFRSQTTRLASTFHALMPPSEVPISSFSQIDNKLKSNAHSSLLLGKYVRISRQKKLYSNITAPSTYQTIGFAIPLERHDLSSTIDGCISRCWC